MGFAMGCVQSATGNCQGSRSSVNRHWILSHMQTVWCVQVRTPTMDPSQNLIFLIDWVLVHMVRKGHLTPVTMCSQQGSHQDPVKIKSKKVKLLLLCILNILYIYFAYLLVSSAVKLLHKMQIFRSLVRDNKFVSWLFYLLHSQQAPVNLTRLGKQLHWHTLWNCLCLS